MKSKPQFSLSDSKSLSRSKWIVGSATLVGVAASSSEAGVVQITLLDNQTSLQGPKSLRADVTGDGLPDFNSFVTQTASRIDLSSFFATIDYRISASFSGGQIARARYLFVRLSPGNSNTSYSATIGSFGGTDTSTFSRGDDPVDLTGFVPVVFSDSRIHQGAVTNGFLQIRSVNIAKNDPAIQFVRTVFDDASQRAPLVNLVANYPEFVPPVDNTVAKAKLARKIKKLRRKIRKTSSIVAKMRLKKKLKKLRKNLKAL